MTKEMITKQMIEDAKKYREGTDVTDDDTRFQRCHIIPKKPFSTWTVEDKICFLHEILDHFNRLPHVPMSNFTKNSSVEEIFKALCTSRTSVPSACIDLTIDMLVQVNYSPEDRFETGFDEETKAS